MRKDHIFYKSIFRIWSDYEWVVPGPSESTEKDHLAEFLKSQYLGGTAETKFRMERNDQQK